MKIRLWLFVCILFVFMMGSVACEKDSGKSSDTAPNGTQNSDDTQNSQGEQCTSPDTHNYVEVSRTDALALKDGEIKYQCSLCKNEKTENIPATKSLKILALGNSFTDDSTWHLWNICKDAGVENVIVANLYVGNCNLNQHWNYIAGSKNPYEYRKTTSGIRVNKTNYSFIDALKDEDWDFIVLHQTSGSAGQANTFYKLDAIIEFINSKKTNPDAKIIWHMPWAYQSDSTHVEFPKYDKDQMKMYETIVARVKEIILPKNTISDIIPSGTAIQNLRTSYVGDRITRDGYHLNYGFGRYTAALTWYAILTGGDVDAPDWIPKEYPEVADYLTVIREAVNGAVANNFAVTESVYKCVPGGEHNYVEISRTDALALKDGEIKYQCSLCKNEKTENIPATKSLKILAIGNSFTQDSTTHLWGICRDAGITNRLVVANLYTGNCSLDTHWNNINNNVVYQEYQKYTSEKAVVSKNTYTMKDAILDDDWDYIVLHQTSGSAGQPETFTKLDHIIKFVNDNKTNPDAKILWHMPWAYQSDSTHGEFPKYDNDQMLMYETIVARAQEIIIPKNEISAIIPTATSIQNLRTSYVGDTLTRDGYHLSYGFGRYTAALTWYAILTGGDVDTPDWVPAAYPGVELYLPAIREAVKGALANNFEVTESKIKTYEDVFDPNDYELLEWDYVTNGWWNCSYSTTITNPPAGDGTYNQNICVDRKYSIEELPVGTVFICDYGWRFRLEQYPTENEKYTGKRDDGQTEFFFLLSEEFLNGCTYVAWSVSSWPKTDISADFDAAYPHVRIYVPKG